MSTLSETERRALGSISWRARRNAFELRVRERPGEAPVSSYVPGPNTPTRRAAAELALAKRLAEAEAGQRHIGSRQTVGAWFDSWLRQQDRLQTAETARQYRQRIDLYLRPVLGPKRLRDLSKADVIEAMGQIAEPRRVDGRKVRRAQLSPTTVAAALRCLKTCLADAYDQQAAPRNAARGVRLPRRRLHIEPPTQSELDLLFAQLEGDPWRAVYSIMRWTGARHGEVLGLEWRHVRPNGTVTFVHQDSGADLKTERSKRTVVLPPAVMAELEAIPRRPGVPYVFATRTGRQLGERNVLRRFDRACAAAGIAPDPSADMDKYRPHDLRHAFATMLREAGVPDAVTCRWLGHTSTAMLDRYSHVAVHPGGDAYRRLCAMWGPEVAGFGLISLEQIAEVIQRTRVDRGLPATIQDPAVLAEVAAILARPAAGR